MVSLWQALVLGLVQGLTEFLPVSSDGHLVIVQQWLGVQSDQLLQLDVFLHTGTLLAILWYFRRDIWQLTRFIHQPDNRRLAMWIVIGSLPTAIIGLLAKDWIEGLFSSVRAAAVGLLITAVILTLSIRLRFKSPPMWLAALLIGVIQGLAVAPGLSRSGGTISLALILSLGYAFAFRFSFLLSIPAIGGALLLELLHLETQPASWTVIAVGVAMAALVGLAALRVLEKLTRKNRLHYFAVYCAALACFVFLMA